MSKICRAAVILIVLFGSANILFACWKTAPPIRFRGITSTEIPRQINGMIAPTDAIEPPEVLAALPSASVTARTYTGESLMVPPIGFVLIGGMDRDALHDPRSCLSGDGWRVTGDHTETIPETNLILHSCRILKTAPDGDPTPGFDVLYLYLIGGKVTHDITAIRTRMLVGTLFSQPGTPVYFLRFQQPLRPDELAIADRFDKVPADHAKLQSFVRTMWKELDLTHRKSETITP